jgi:putative endonuclease
MEGRLQLHNTNHGGYTGKNNDWQMVYTECYESKQEVLQREQKVKKWKPQKNLVILFNQN